MNDNENPEEIDITRYLSRDARHTDLRKNAAIPSVVKAKFENADIALAIFFSTDLVKEETTSEKFLKTVALDEVITKGLPSALQGLQLAHALLHMASMITKQQVVDIIKNYEKEHGTLDGLF